MRSSEDLRNGSTPTVLLVHGPFADTSSWAGVIAQLQTAGIDAVAPANPLRGLSADARYIASVAEEIDGPTMLVGHCYGGAVITVAAALAGNVVGLVYVTAFALDEGESVLDLSARFPESLLTAALRPAVCPDRDDQSIVELYIDRGAFPRVFAADLSATVAAVAAATQRPIVAAALEERASAAAWKTLQCWYVVATADRVIDPDAQRFMAARATARPLEVDASHAVATSDPELVADLIQEAALATRRTGPTASPLQATTSVIGRIERELT
jgi:pimeloyl-ACP methyl ester carboxylesterase